MRKLLTKRWHGVPVALIAIPAITGVVAAAFFTLWSGEGLLVVSEPITLWTGTSAVDQPTQLTGLDNSLDDLVLAPGECHTEWLKIVSATAANLTVQGVFDIDGPATVTAYYEGGGVAPLFDGGVCVTSAEDVLIRIEVALPGSAELGSYNFTRSYSRG